MPYAILMYSDYSELEKMLETRKMIDRHRKDELQMPHNMFPQQSKSASTLTMAASTEQSGSWYSWIMSPYYDL